MAGKKGNKNAQKWDKATLLKVLHTFYNDIRDEKIVYLGIILAKYQLYNDIWSDWTNKFKDDQVVSLTIKRVEALIEANLLEQALSNKVNSTIAIFVLKNKYRWADKQEIDHTSKGESLSINITKTYKNKDEGDSN